MTAASILREVAEFVDKEVIPLEPAFLAGGYSAVAEQLHTVRRSAQSQGLWAPFMPVEHGGMGLALRHFAPISAALGASPLGHYAMQCQAPDAGNMELLASHGDARQHQEYLGPLMRGETRGSFAMTEPEFAGSNPVHMATTASRDGDDYIINGHKWFTTGAHQSAFTIVMAITDVAAEKPHERASLLIVPDGTPGYEHVRRIAIMGEKGAGPFSHSELRFTDCRVPRANRIGAQGAGFRLAQERLGPGRIHHCMRWIGICERAFELMCRRAASRELSPGKMLSSRQTVQNWIAECRAEIDAARLLTLDAARRIDAEGARAARRQISQIKFHVAAVLQNVLDRAIQVHGAAGLCDDSLLAFWYRHERAARIYDGPDEVHKSVVARAALGDYA
ncbi:MAG: acyl-CoA dehydrogenase family protein [Gammaproteobacteria bacterium]|nr:acyl-CoA dehydrogenase family protein [Gammaproteobacteria bacterium]NNF61593.1 acyl-CoA dehydrogenase [Gammaproteobacteria bacterium]